MLGEVTCLCVMLVLGDWFFLIFHSALIVFNITGWGLRVTRRWNLLTLTLTALSWFAIGLIYGRVGYCVCTDWHWRIREALGRPIEADSYIQFLVEVLTGYRPSSTATQWVSGIVFFVSVIFSVTLNLRDWRTSRLPEPKGA